MLIIYHASTTCDLQHICRGKISFSTISLYVSILDWHTQTILFFLLLQLPSKSPMTSTIGPFMGKQFSPISRPSLPIIKLLTLKSCQTWLYKINDKQTLSRLDQLLDLNSFDHSSHTYFYACSVSQHSNNVPFFWPVRLVWSKSH